MAEEERHHSAAETSSAVTTADDIPPPASDPTKEKVVVDEAKDGAAITPQSEAERQERYRQIKILETTNLLLQAEKDALEASIIEKTECNRRLEEMIKELQAEDDELREEDENMATLMHVLRLAGVHHDCRD
ncbi:hypothetical protein IFR04_008301 [Cadophora malorum]|uniref:Uncharacterized protein n=1 Tax=Cadophora malorum TaxID=108018 RepID=A0A8H7TBK6_9HELO|nr:hypothetical protein IFR04_008301 [Cadophora malorum]